MNKNSGDFYENLEKRKPLRFLRNVLIVFVILFGVFLILNPDFFDEDFIKLFNSKIPKSSESTEIEMTEEQKMAIHIVESYDNPNPFSKKQLLSIMNNYYSDSFTTEDIEFAFKYLNINWKEEALKKGNYLSDEFHYSKNIIEKELSNEDYGFEDEEVKYAMENLIIDNKENAVKWAQERGEQLYLSKKALYDYMIYERGGGFTEEEALYAIDKVNIDWKNNALKKGEDLFKHTDMNEKDIYKHLKNEKIGKFTEEEAKYAVENLKNKKELEN